MPAAIYGVSLLVLVLLGGAIFVAGNIVGDAQDRALHHQDQARAKRLGIYAGILACSGALMVTIGFLGLIPLFALSF